MFDLKEIKGLLLKEVKLEWRSKHVAMSTLLYVFSTVFICYLSFQNAELGVWNGLIWIIVLFTMTNASNRIFFYESGNQRLYLYSLAGARNIIAAKLIYQWFISALLSLLVFIIWTILFNAKVHQTLNFLIVLILGVWAMSNVLTLNNALSSGTKNSPTVLAILSFPVLLPILLTTIKGSAMALQSNLNSNLPYFILVLFMLNVLTVSLAIILFQYLWRY